MKAELETYLTGTLAGAGSFRCRACGYAVALNALDEVPRCPGCGSERFARASMFDTAAVDDTPSLDREENGEWVEAVRDELEEPGHFLAYRDGERVSVMPLLSDWIRIGRSLTADIRFDDPTVSRRHAIVVREPRGVRVLDDRSLNGVFLNGERVEWGPLSDGDELIVGRHRLHFIENVSDAGSLSLDESRAAA
jgi:hypothetical protein